MIRLKTEKEKMISGEKYNPANPRLVLERARANRICTKYNKRSFNEINMKSRLMRNLINTNGKFWIKPPFFVIMDIIFSLKKMLCLIMVVSY